MIGSKGPQTSLRASAGDEVSLSSAWLISSASVLPAWWQWSWVWNSIACGCLPESSKLTFFGYWNWTSWYVVSWLRRYCGGRFGIHIHKALSIDLHRRVLLTVLLSCIAYCYNNSDTCFCTPAQSTETIAQRSLYCDIYPARSLFSGTESKCACDLPFEHSNMRRGIWSSGSYVKFVKTPYEGDTMVSDYDHCRGIINWPGLKDCYYKKAEETLPAHNSWAMLLYSLNGKTPL